MDKRQAKFFNEDGSPKHVRIYIDHEQKTADYITVIFGRMNVGECLYIGMNDRPYHPQGFCQHGSAPDAIDRPRYSHLGKPAKWSDLNADCQKVVRAEVISLRGLDNAG